MPLGLKGLCHAYWAVAHIPFSPIDAKWRPTFSSTSHTLQHQLKQAVATQVRTYETVMTPHFTAHIAGKASSTHVQRETLSVQERNGGMLPLHE